MADADDCAGDNDGEDGFRREYLDPLKIHIGFIKMQLAGNSNGYGLTEESFRYVRLKLDSLWAFLNECEIVVSDQCAHDAFVLRNRYREMCEARDL